MVNKVKMMFDITKFEAVSEDSENKLVGGFSASVANRLNQDQQTAEANNCQGGNCESGCGGGQTLNGAPGCGQKL